MTIEEILKSKGLYEVNNIRYLKFYMSYIYEEFDEIPMSKESQNKEDLQRKINYIFNNAVYDLESHVEDMNKKSIENFLPDNSFIWIDKNEDRMNYFIWSILRLMTYRRVDDQNNKFGYKLSLDDCLKNLKERERNPYYSSELNLVPLNRIEMRNLVFDFFDQWDAKASAKEKLMRKLKKEWIYVTNDLDPDYSWIDEKNKKQNIWIYEYIKSKDYFLPHLPKPASLKQFYNMNIAILDSLFVLGNGKVNDTSNKISTPKEDVSKVNSLKEIELEEYISGECTSEDDIAAEETSEEVTPKTNQISHDDVMYKMMKAWKQQVYRDKKDRK